MPPVHEDLTFSVPVVNVMGTVQKVLAASYEEIHVQSYTGPAGPYPMATASDAYYLGDLTLGNHFGSVDAVIAGRFKRTKKVKVPVDKSALGSSGPGPAGGLGGIFAAIAGAMAPDEIEVTLIEHGTFNATAHMTINPPNQPIWQPAAVTVPAGKPGPDTKVEVTVAPAGPYEIVLTVETEGRVGLFVPTFVRTRKDGTGEFFVKDLLGQKRGPIKVDGVTTPWNPCVGTPVRSSFHITVA